MIRAIRPNAMAQDDAAMVSGWNIAPNLAYTLVLLPGPASCVALLYDDDGSALVASGAALTGTDQPCILVPQTGQTIEMVDTDLGWHLLLTTTGTEGQRTIRIGPAVDLPDEVHPVYGEDALALARATAAIDAAAHYIDDVTVTCPLGLGAGLGDVVSVPVDGVAVAGQVESITWTATPDGAIAQAVIRRHTAIAPVGAAAPPTPPDVADDTGETDADTEASGNVLSNDDTGLTVVAVNGYSSLVGDEVAGSNGGVFVIDEDGSWTFDPGGDFAALTGSETADTSVTYYASDGVAEAMATLTVTVSAASTPTLWTPAEISGARWFDPDDAAHRVLDGSALTSLVDVVGGSVALSQSTAAAKPSLVTAALADCDVASFDGGDYLAGTIIAPGSAPISIFAVWLTTDSATDVAAMVGAASANAALGIGRNPTTGGYNVFVWGRVEKYISGTYSRWVMTLGQRNSSGLRAGLDGSLTAYASTSLNIASGEINVGRTPQADGYLNGQLAALVIGAFTDDEVDRLFGWAAHKYGLAGNLPAGHPYKSAPPTL